MKLKHNISGRLITIPGVSANPVLLTGNLHIGISALTDEPTIFAEFLLTWPQGTAPNMEPCLLPLERVYQAIEGSALNGV